MINAQSKAELEAIKKFHREESVKEAWGMLDDSIFIQHQESLAEARKAEAQRLSKLAGQAGKQAERLRHYLANEMVKANKKSVKGVKHHLSLRKKPPRVIVNCQPSQLPPEYVKVEYTPKLTKIKDLLKSDSQGAIDWASLSESHEYSVTIR
jgi:hypothetical protein